MDESRSYTMESEPMSLLRFAESYRPHPASPQTAMFESGLHSAEQQLLTDGQVFTACGTKKVQVLQARLPSSLTVCIPVTSNTLFAMVPADDNEMDKIVCKKWEKVFTSVADIVKCTPLPPALKVMADCVDHKKRSVPLGTHLYNVEVVEKRQGLHKRKGITAMTSNGEPHTFLEGSSVRLSSQQSHTKSHLTHFYYVVKFPQRARVFQNDLEDRGIENLSEITFTDRGQEEYLVIETDCSSAGQEAGMNTGARVYVPLKANVKVAAVSLKKTTAVQRPLLRSTNASSPTDEIYLLEPISHPDSSQSETTGDGEQEYQNMEPTYDLPTPSHRTERGRSGSVKESAVKHQLAKNPHTESLPVLYYNVSQTRLDQSSVQSGADHTQLVSTSRITESVATPPHKQKGPPPAVKPKPVQHMRRVRRTSSEVMQEQVGMMQHQPVVSQQSLDGDVVEYANFGAVKVMHRPLEEKFSLTQQPSTARQSVKGATLPQQPSTSYRERSATLPQQPTSRHSAQTASLPRQPASHPSVKSTSVSHNQSKTSARSKSLVATPLTVVARDNNK